MIVINKNSQDIHNRYKMPSLIIKHEGKNTGVKTVLVNIEDVSKSLGRKPEHLLKYFGYSLSLQCKNDGKYVINGKHDQSKMQNLVYAFIDHFVLCYSCENPETFFILDPNLKIECLACGSKSSVLDHKLNTEISKNFTLTSTIYTDFLPVKNQDEFENQEDDLLTGSSEEIYNRYKMIGLEDEEIFMKMLKDNYNNIDFLVKKGSSKMILSVYEDYVEKYKKYNQISQFIDFLLEQGYKKNEVSKYYTRPQSGKKRSVDFKKEINKYFTS